MLTSQAKNVTKARANNSQEEITNRNKHMKNIKRNPNNKSFGNYPISSDKIITHFMLIRVW